MSQVVNDLTGEVLEKEENNFRYEIAKTEIGAIITDDVVDMMEKYYMAKAVYDRWMAENKDAIQQILEATGTKKIEANYTQIIYVAETIRKIIDTQRLKEEMPEVYEKYLKETKVKASVRVIMKEA